MKDLDKKLHCEKLLLKRKPLTWQILTKSSTVKNYFWMKSFWHDRFLQKVLLWKLTASGMKDFDKRFHGEKLLLNKKPLTLKFFTKKLHREKLLLKKKLLTWQIFTKTSILKMTLKKSLWHEGFWQKFLWRKFNFEEKASDMQDFYKKPHCEKLHFNKKLLTWQIFTKSSTVKIDFRMKSFWHDRFWQKIPWWKLTFEWKAFYMKDL